MSSLSSTTKKIVRSKRQVGEAKKLEEPPEHLRDFFTAAWPVVEPGIPLVGGWHIDALCDHLEAVTRGHIKRLVINVPPGSSKTTAMQIMWPAWEWLHHPEMKFLFATHGANLAIAKGARCLQLVESDWYRELCGDRWYPDRRQWAKSNFGNDQGGWRAGTSVGAFITGFHADRRGVDDPINPQDAKTGQRRKVSRIELENAWEWLRTTFSTRVTSPNAPLVILQQRLHDLDPCGRIEEEMPGEYEVLRIPFEYEPKYHCTTTLKPAVTDQVENDNGEVEEVEVEPAVTWEDPRTEEGEVVWSRWDDQDFIRLRRLELGSAGWASQMQQRPLPEGGSIFKREHIQYYRQLPIPVKRAESLFYVQSWDCAFKGKEDSDWVVGQVWARWRANFYLVHQVRDRMTFSATKRAMLHMHTLYPQARKVLVEDAANGPAVCDELQDDIPGLELVTPEGGKEARANAVEPYFDAMNVWLPHPEIADWVRDYVTEIVRFPMAANDDQVDATTQALIWLSQHSMAKWIEIYSEIQV